MSNNIEDLSIEEKNKVLNEPGSVHYSGGNGKSNGGNSGFLSGVQFAALAESEKMEPKVVDTKLNKQLVAFKNKTAQEVRKLTKIIDFKKDKKIIDEKKHGFISSHTHYNGCFTLEELVAELDILDDVDTEDYYEEFVRIPESIDVYRGIDLAEEMFDGRIVDKYVEAESPFLFFEGDLRHPETGELKRVCVMGQNGAPDTGSGRFKPEHHQMYLDKLYYCENKGVPVVSFMDTPGADAGVESNINNQSELISACINKSGSLNVPQIGVVVGQGGSGGAQIGLAGADRRYAFKNSYYYTIHFSALSGIARKEKLKEFDIPKMVRPDPISGTRDAIFDGVIKMSTEKKHELDVEPLVRTVFSAIEDIEKEIEEGGKNYRYVLEYVKYLKNFGGFNITIEDVLNNDEDSLSEVLEKEFQRFKLKSSRNKDKLDNFDDRIRSYDEFVKFHLKKNRMERRLQATTVKEQEPNMKKWYKEYYDKLVCRIKVKEKKLFSNNNSELVREFEALKNEFGERVSKVNTDDKKGHIIILIWKEKQLAKILAKQKKIGVDGGNKVNAEELEKINKEFKEVCNNTYIDKIISSEKNKFQQNMMKWWHDHIGLNKNVHTVKQVAYSMTKQKFVDYILYRFISYKGYEVGAKTLKPLFSAKSPDELKELLADTGENTIAHVFKDFPEEAYKVATYYMVLDNIATILCKKPVMVLDELNEGDKNVISEGFLNNLFREAIGGFDVTVQGFLKWIKSYPAWHEKSVDFILDNNNVIDPIYKNLTPLLSAIIREPVYKNRWKFWGKDKGDLAVKELKIDDINKTRFPAFWSGLSIMRKDQVFRKLMKEKYPFKKPQVDDVLKLFIDESEIDEKFVELDKGLISANAKDFKSSDPTMDSFQDKIFLNVINDKIKYKGALTTGILKIDLDGKEFEFGIAVSNPLFQAGSIDQSCGIKIGNLLEECKNKKLPVVFFLSSGGMNTKVGVGALESMAINNTQIRDYVTNTKKPVIMMGYGNSMGGTQAAHLTHPLVHTYYLTGTDCLFAGQKVVPEYLKEECRRVDMKAAKENKKFTLVKNPWQESMFEDLCKIYGEDMVVDAEGEVVNEIKCHFRDLQDGVKMMPDELVNTNVEKKEKTIDFESGYEKPVNFDIVIIANRNVIDKRYVEVLLARGVEVIQLITPDDKDKIIYEGCKAVYIDSYTDVDEYLAVIETLKLENENKNIAIAPGYGFLAENYKALQKFNDAGVFTIGPKPETVEKTGSKVNCNIIMKEAEVPLLPGSFRNLESAEDALAVAEKVGYPVMLKADTGGGGKGIKKVNCKEEMVQKFNTVKAEASTFPTDGIFLEKCVENARHIEFQVNRDRDGNIVVYDERDCTAQRDGQKVIEESPSLVLPQELREQLKKAIAIAAEKLDIHSPVTFEFLYDLDTGFVSFMEINPRIQVEHGVTNALYSNEDYKLDLLDEQIRISEGGLIDVENAFEGRNEKQKYKHCIELRLNAEDPSLNYAVSADKITKLQVPKIPGVHFDLGIKQTRTIAAGYDSMYGTVIATATSDESQWDARKNALKKLDEALESFVIKGPTTNKELLLTLINSEEIIKGTDYTTMFLDSELQLARLQLQDERKKIESNDNEWRDVGCEFWDKQKWVGEIQKDFPTGEDFLRLTEEEVLNYECHGKNLGYLANRVFGLENINQTQIMKEELNSIARSIYYVEKDSVLKITLGDYEKARMERQKKALDKYKTTPTFLTPKKGQYFHQMLGKAKFVNEGEIYEMDDQLTICTVQKHKNFFTARDLSIHENFSDIRDKASKIRIKNVNYKNGEDCLSIDASFPLFEVEFLDENENIINN